MNPANEESGDASNEGNKGGDAKHRILVVDDVQVNRALMGRLLARAGFDVECACDGREAVDVASAAWKSGDPYHIVLMDIDMPELDGYEATRMLRDAGYMLPIIALTAHSDDKELRECLAAGCDDVVTKPFDLANLLAMIREQLGEPFLDTATVDPAQSEKKVRKGLSQLVDEDPKLGALIDKFVNGLDLRTQNIEEAIEREDWESVSHLAHQLKGAAGLYGYPEILKFADYVEQGARDSVPDQIKSAFRDLVNACGEAA